MELDTLKLHVSRAENAFARGEAENARQMAAQVVQDLSGSTARNYLKWLEARAALVQGLANLQLGHPSDALPLLQRAVELRQSTVDPSSVLLAIARIGLANCYLDLGESEKAKALSDGAAKAFAAHHEVGSQFLKPFQELQNRIRRAFPSRRAG
jgi:tetratricopeptide (TPR) repeat protein